MRNCVRESVWQRVNFDGKGQQGKHETREKYRGESTRDRLFKDRKISYASFMFYNYPETWCVADLWRMFKGYGTVFDIYMVKKKLRSGQKYGFVRFKNIADVDFLYKRLCSITFSNKQRLMIFLAHNRKFGAGGEKIDTNNNMNKEGVKVRDRDGRRYIDVLSGMSKLVSEEKVKNGTEGHAPNKDVREIEITDKDMEGGVIKRWIVGEVKKIEFIEKLPEFCSIVGLWNVDVKYMGDVETAESKCSQQIIRKTYVANDHRSSDSMLERKGRVLIHTWEDKLISEELYVKIRRNKCKVLVKEESDSCDDDEDEDSDDGDDEVVEETAEIGGAQALRKFNDVREKVRYECPKADYASSKEALNGNVMHKAARMSGEK
ncbi:transposon TX1 [Tanacetum coccineum]